jgi:hypothetical protein
MHEHPDIEQAKLLHAEGKLVDGPDAWEHRAETMVCASCMWWLPKGSEMLNTNIAPGRKLGRCRRRAPTMNGFPAVWGCDWCGDHKLDEAKA